MVTTDVVGVGVWGVGDHARRNTLPALAHCPDLRLVGLTTRNETVRQEQARMWGCQGWSDPKEMLESSAVDVVYLATPVGLHFQHGLRVLEAGRHLWCEKSLTDSLRASQQLVSNSAEHDLALCEAFMYTHHPQFKQLLKWIDTDEIGRVRSITSRFGFPHLEPDNIRYASKLGGGALLDIGAYPLSAALLITGEQPSVIESHISSDADYEVDTAGSALLHFPSGAYAILEWGYGRSYRAELQIWGGEGTIFAERAFSKPATLSPELVLRRRDGSSLQEKIEPANHFVAMFSSFAHALSDGTLRDAYRQQALQQARLVSAVLNPRRES